MSKKKYFYKDATGVNADVERHRNKEEELRYLIAHSDGEHKKAYQFLLSQLLLSKADVVSKIGRK